MGDERRQCMVATSAISEFDDALTDIHRFVMDAVICPDQHAYTNILIEDANALYAKSEALLRASARILAAACGEACIEPHPQVTLDANRNAATELKASHLSSTAAGRALQGVRPPVAASSFSDRCTFDTCTCPDGPNAATRARHPALSGGG